MSMRVPDFEVSSVELRDIAAWMILRIGCLNELYWPELFMTAHLVERWHVNPEVVSSSTGLDIFTQLE